MQERPVGMKSPNTQEEADQPPGTPEDIRSGAEQALTDLSAALTAARALVALSLAEGGASNGPVLDKRLNALEFVLRQAGHAEDILWVAIDELGASANGMAPEPC